MKKVTIILAVAIAVLSTLCTSAQVSPVERVILTGTLTNAGTTNLSFNGVKSGLKSIQVTVTKVSGTVAGDVYIQATVDGSSWVSVTDTLTLTNVTTNTKVWVFTATNYNSYRAAFVGSGTQSANVSAALLRRTDE